MRERVINREYIMSLGCTIDMNKNISSTNINETIKILIDGELFTLENDEIDPLIKTDLNCYDTSFKDSYSIKKSNHNRKYPNGPVISKNNLKVISEMKMHNRFLHDLFSLGYVMYCHSEEISDELLELLEIDRYDIGYVYNSEYMTYLRFTFDELKKFNSDSIVEFITDELLSDDILFVSGKNAIGVFIAKKRFSRKRITDIISTLKKVLPHDESVDKKLDYMITNIEIELNTSVTTDVKPLSLSSYYREFHNCFGYDRMIVSDDRKKYKAYAKLNNA